MLFFDKAPLKSKLIGIIALTTIAVLGASIIAIVIYDQRNFLDTRRQQQQILSAIVADRSTAALAFGDAANARGNLDALRANPTILAACLFRDGRLFASFLRAGAAATCPRQVPQFVDQQISGNRLATVQPVVMNEQTIGSLYIFSSLDELRQRSINFASITLLLLLITGSIGFLLASRLIGYAIFPLVLLGRTATTITQNNDYSVRSSKGFDDDIGLLIDTFNGMLETIQTQNSALIHSEETLKTIINDAPDLIQIVNRNGEITFVNRTDEGAKTPSPNTPLTLFEGLDAEQRNEAKNVLQTVFESGITAQFEAYDQDNNTWYANHVGPLRENGVIGAALVMKRDISALKSAHEKLKQIAFYDPLTGLPNRRLFKERLEDELTRCRKQRTKMALLFLDLDNFKRINDTLGHDAGDRLLTTIAERVVGCVRREDSVARLGGDEFTVLLGGLDGVEAAIHVAEKILQRLREPVDLGRVKITATVSIGITLAPDDASHSTELMKKADIAMYKAKEIGRNAYQVYNDSMDPYGADTLKMETQLRAALDENQFKIYYQPQIAIDTGKVIGLEALMRWDHPERGLLSPAAFLHQLEELGLIMPLTKWTLDTACKEMQRAGLIAQRLDGVKLAINISAGQFRDPNLVGFVKNILQLTGFPAARLELEITETSLISSLEESVATMTALRDLGVSLSIDDFGTGYASLSYLRKLPVDFVKIDGSFIKDIPHSKSDMEITSAVIAMSHKLNLKVLAEGVETSAQMQFLRDNKCDYAQGFLISPPLPLEALLALETQFDLQPA